MAETQPLYAYCTHERHPHHSELGYKASFVRCESIVALPGEWIGVCPKCEQAFVLKDHRKTNDRIETDA